MSYNTETIAASLREARTAKGLSQRVLSAMTGVPQAQISRIEAGTVDPRTTSLVALAHALDMELALVPRKAVPAVRSISRQAIGPSSKSIAASLKEMNRISETLRNLQIKMPALEGITQLQKSFAGLERFQSLDIDPDVLRNIRKTMERLPDTSDQQEAIERSLNSIRGLRNQLAHQPLASQAEDRPKPAYSLDEDDDA
ncbi:helix-turn-helix domain-containing protein [Roseivivax lentus]|nr:helix-turn-helix transcriptional regulator [Roseivivax lentus]